MLRVISLFIVAMTTWCHRVNLQLMPSFVPLALALKRFCPVLFELKDKKYLTTLPKALMLRHEHSLLSRSKPFK